MSSYLQGFCGGGCPRPGRIRPGLQESKWEGRRSKLAVYVENRASASSANPGISGEEKLHALEASAWARFSLGQGVREGRAREEAFKYRTTHPTPNGLSTEDPPDLARPSDGPRK